MQQGRRPSKPSPLLFFLQQNGTELLLRSMGCLLNLKLPFRRDCTPHLSARARKLCWCQIKCDYEPPQPPKFTIWLAWISEQRRKVFSNYIERRKMGKGQLRFQAAELEMFAAMCRAACLDINYTDLLSALSRIRGTNIEPNNERYVGVFNINAHGKRRTIERPEPKRKEKKLKNMFFHYCRSKDIKA